MRAITVIALSLFILIACGQSNPTASTQNTPEQASITKHTNSSLEKKEACEYVSMEKLAAIMNWDAGSIQSELSMSLKDRDLTVCNLMYEDEKLMIRLAWKSDKAQANKVLERNYTKRLAEGEGDLTYSELSNNPEGQMLWGMGQDRFGQSMYILRKRIGNEIDIQLEAVSMTKNEDAFLVKLKKILGNIEG